MAKAPMTFSPAEQAYLAGALDLAIASAKRGQNTAKQPEFKALYLANENELQKLKIKVAE